MKKQPLFFIFYSIFRDSLLRDTLTTEYHVYLLTEEFYKKQ